MVPALRAWRGYLETPPNRTVFAEMISSRGGPDLQGLPWCVTFVFAVHPGARRLGAPCAGIRGLLRRLFLRGRLRGRAWHPRAGDLVFLRNDPAGGPEHVEILLETDGEYLVSIGGNARDPSRRFPPGYGGAVDIRCRDAQDPKILGFGKLHDLKGVGQNEF